MRKIFAILSLCGLVAAFPILGTAQEVSQENIPEEEVLEAEVSQEIEVYAEEIEPDANFILVEKQFSGITPEQIPENFQIQVTQKSGEENYMLTEADVIGKSEDGLTWQWRIDDVGVGHYSVTESGEEIANYEVITTGTGEDVEVKAADFAIEAGVETTCSHTNWPVKIDGDRNTLFAAALTANTGCVVISKTPLTASQKAAVAAKVTAIGGNWKDPVAFYSIAENGNGPYLIAGRELRYDPETEEVILKDTSNWTHVAKLGYSVSEAANPDINITNDYIPSTIEINIRKIVSGSMGDRTKTFDFTVTCTEAMEAGSGYTLSEDGLTAEFTLGHEETMTLYGLQKGSTLTISEKNADGYAVRIQVGETVLEGNSYTIPPDLQEPVTITITNRKEVIPDTGIFTDSLPYILIVAAAVVEGVVLLLKRRGKWAVRWKEYHSLLRRIMLLTMTGWLLFAKIFLITQVSGNAMYPAVKDGDLLIGFRRQREYAKNDVVVCSVDGETYVGRVAAGETDVVMLDESGTMTVNGTAQHGEILYPTYAEEGGKYPLRLKKGQMFLLGDYRTQTVDSRDFGPVQMDDVEGKVITILRRRGL